VPRFVAAAPPSGEDMARLVRTIYHRLKALLTRRGVLTDGGELSLPLLDEPSALDLCQAAAVGIGTHSGQEAFEMLGQHAVQDRALGLAPRVLLNQPHGIELCSRLPNGIGANR